MKDTFVGKILWFAPKNGYGFIEWSKDGIKQKDMFCHFSDICMEGFKVLKKDQMVSFSIGVNTRGQPKATEIAILKNGQ